VRSSHNHVKKTVEVFRRKSMSGKLVNTIACFALVVVLGGAGPAHALDAKTPYPTMAPLDQYLMTDRNAEIALARSAAPDSISRDAKILVLGRHGYETAAQGKNGFVCVVERAWGAPSDHPEFWNPKVRAPICLNPPAARSVLPLTIKRTEWVLAGLSKAQIIDNVKTALDRKELPPFEPGAMSYMMSKQAYLTDEDGHNMAHLMIYAPLTDAAVWGANQPGSPVMAASDTGDRLTVFLIPVGQWSDGTTAPTDVH
jgi:hypothetical protein